MCGYLLVPIDVSVVVCVFVSVVVSVVVSVDVYGPGANLHLWNSSCLAVDFDT